MAQMRGRRKPLKFRILEAGGPSRAFSLQLLVARYRHRSRHRQHRRLRPRPGHRRQRAVGGGDGDREWRSKSPRGRRRRQADDGKDARQHPHHPPAARGRDRRPRGGRGNDQAFYPQGAWRPKSLRPRARGGDLHPVGRDVGRAARDPRRSHQRRRRQGFADRGADGGRDRRGAAGRRADRVDGRRHRRRHHRGRSDLAAGPRLLPLASAATRWTRRSLPTCAATTIC